MHYIIICKQMKKYLAEALGTMVLVFMGCSAAISLGCDNGIPESVIGTATAFGIAVIAMAYTIGGISGCHINPSITLAAFLTGRINGKDAAMYVVSQVIGGIAGSAVLYALVNSAGLVGIFANDLQTNGAAAIPVFGGLLAEMLFTCVLVFVFLGATSKTNGTTNNFAGLVIGLAYLLVHLCCMRYTGTSVNPARSVGPAIFQGGTALAHLWIFIVGPTVGGAVAALLWKIVAPSGR